MAAERDSTTPELPGQLVETGRVPAAGGTWPLGVAPAMRRMASVTSSFHRGHEPESVRSQMTLSRQREVARTAGDAGKPS